MNALPVDLVLPEIVDALRSKRALVLVAPPGSGKTTRVPPAILRAGLLSDDHSQLLLLQPRRVAARASARRIAEESGWTLGEEVGYQIRFENRTRPSTRLRVMTEGILNKRLVADPFLEGVGAVVLDEFHERSLHSDLAIAMLKEVRESVREDLLVVVMSATLDAEPIAKFLGDCPIIRAEGRPFPVAIRYRPRTQPGLVETVVESVRDVVTSREDAGHILVFLPGAEEIRRVASRLEDLAQSQRLAILPLHGALSSDEQDKALRPSDRTKLILATNIAETSLTIEGVTTVIDGGLARVASYDHVRGLDRLELCRISKASAAQRAGRAGRVAPGCCIRLWSEGEQRGLDETEQPEIARVDLASTVLTLHAWGVAEPARFGWFAAPSEERLAAAERLLGLLGALDPQRRLTQLGRRLLDVPAHPRIARLLLASAESGQLRAGAALAALLSERDFVQVDRARREPGSSDVLLRLDRLDEAERTRFSPQLRGRGIDPIGARRIARVRDDLMRIARRLQHVGTSLDAPDEETMLRWILLAYPDRVVRRRGAEATGVMVGGRGVRLEPESVVRDAEFFLALDPREDRRAAGVALEARVRIASRIEAGWLEEEFPAEMRTERTVVFDPERQGVVGISSLCYRDLRLREDRSAKVDASEASEVLAGALRERAEAFVRDNEAAAAWLARLEFVRRAVAEREWPTFDDEAFAEVVRAACLGQRSLEGARRVPLVPLLRSRLTPPQARDLDELAPEALVVPSGNRVRLAYEPGRAPILAARLQELFGWVDTPRVAGGRVAVVLQLLGPNFRPVQVTSDLRSFWANAYFQVRKDLRARYPKHAWPENPLTASPEAKGTRRS